MAAPPAPRPPEARQARQASTIRAMREDDLDAILEMERISFPGIPPDHQWKPDQVLAHVRRFPEAQWIAERDGRVVGSCMNMRTTWARATAPHTWHGITGGGRLREHVPDGDVLYGTEIMVHPDARRQGVGRRLFEHRFAFVVEHRLRAFVTGGRLPGYGAHAERYTCDQYVRRVAHDELIDPVLTADVRWGLEPRGVLCGYMHDPPSLHHASLLVWENPQWPGADEQG